MKSVDCVRSPEKSGGCLIFCSCGFVVPLEEEVEEGSGVAVAVAGIAEVGAATTGEGAVSVMGFTSSSEGSGVEGAGDCVCNARGESMGVTIHDSMQLIGQEASLEDRLALAIAAAG